MKLTLSLSLSLSLLLASCKSYELTYLATGAIALNLIFPKKIVVSLLELGEGFLNDENRPQYLSQSYQPTLKQALEAKNVKVGLATRVDLFLKLFGTGIRFVSSILVGLWFVLRILKFECKSSKEKREVLTLFLLFHTYLYESRYMPVRGKNNGFLPF
jgi:hypothetical protein